MSNCQTETLQTTMTTKEFADAASLTDESIISDSGSDVQLFDDGELAILSIDLDAGDSVQDSQTVDSGGIVMTSSQNVDSVYGSPLSEKEAKERMPYGNGGLVWHATVIPDEYVLPNGSVIAGLNKRDFDDSPAKAIKPRRPSLPLTMTQLFSSLTKIDGPEGTRYIFHGVLNGWPSLRTFELVKLEKKRSIGPLTPPDYMNVSKLTWSNYWSVEKEGREDIGPEIKDKHKIYRATLRGAPWTSVGWYVVVCHCRESILVQVHRYSCIDTCNFCVSGLLKVRDVCFGSRNSDLVHHVCVMEAYLLRFWVTIGVRW